MSGVFRSIIADSGWLVWRVVFWWWWRWRRRCWCFIGRRVAFRLSWQFTLFRFSFWLGFTLWLSAGFVLGKGLLSAVGSFLNGFLRFWIVFQLSSSGGCDRSFLSWRRRYGNVYDLGSLFRECLDGLADNGLQQGG